MKGNTRSFSRRSFVLSATALACAAAIGLTSPAALAQNAPAKLIITAIPDDGDADRMRENFGALATYLGEQVGIPVEYMHVENYAASVTALATGRAHIAWLGAVTIAQAHMQMNDGLTVLGCRDIDKGFVSYFVANPSTGLGELADLGEMAEAAKGKNWTFTFGSKSSTSSHLMPRKFFTDQAGTPPERVFRTVAYSGSHDVVMRMVADGTHHIGAMNYASWDNAPEELQKRAPVVYKTPEYTNYALTARTDLGPELIGQLTTALLSLDENSEEGRKFLGYLKAGKFIEADLSEWAPYRELLESGVDIGG